MLDGRLKLRHLLLVDALTARGSVVGAAAALHVTQPVVTRGLQELERILGVELYERGPRGMLPNESGAAFTEYARSVLAQLTQATRHLAEIADGSSGYVVVGNHLAGSSLLVPRAIAQLKSHRPKLRVVIREATPESLLEDLVAGRVDLIVGRLSGPAPHGTIRRTLYEESVRIVARPAHPLAGRARVTLDDLSAYPWILPGTETMLRAELEALFSRNGHPIPADRVEATAFLTVRQLLIETDMVAAMLGSIGTADPGLVTLPIVLDLVEAQVGLTLAAGRRLNPASEAMVDSLVTAARDLR